MLTHSQVAELLGSLRSVVLENQALLENNTALRVQCSILAGENGALRDALKVPKREDAITPPVAVPATEQQLEILRAERAEVMTPGRRLAIRKKHIQDKIADLQKELESFNPENDPLIR